MLVGRWMGADRCSRRNRRLANRCCRRARMTARVPSTTMTITAPPISAAVTEANRSGTVTTHGGVGTPVAFITRHHQPWP